MKYFFIKNKNRRWKIECRILNWFHSKLKIKNLKFYSRAFTLVETLTAMTIIIMAILGPLTVAVYSYSYATETRDNMTATYLAEEVIELLRYKRDTEFIKYKQGLPVNDVFNYSTPWDNFKGLFGDTASTPKTGCYSATGCYFDTSTVDSNTTPFPVCDSASSCKTLYRDNNFLYSYTVSATSTSFSRIVTMQNISEPLPNSSDENYIRVSSLVNYKSSNGFTRKVEVIDFIHRRGLN